MKQHEITHIILKINEKSHKKQLKKINGALSPIK